MALDETQLDYLETILAAVGEAAPNQLSEWEISFMADQQGRFEEWGDNMLLSAKQWNIIHKVGSALDVEKPSAFSQNA